MAKGVRRSLVVFVVSLLVFASAAPVAQQAIPAPSDFLKMKIGGDGVLASYEQIVSYFRAIDPLSDRITLEDLGPTTMGHPMINAIITSPENMKKLDVYREINNRLYDTRKRARTRPSGSPPRARQSSRCR
jgi:hypothetical protein